MYLVIAVLGLFYSLRYKMPCICCRHLQYKTIMVFLYCFYFINYYSFQLYSSRHLISAHIKLTGPSIVHHNVQAYVQTSIRQAFLRFLKFALYNGIYPISILFLFFEYLAKYKCGSSFIIFKLVYGFIALHTFYLFCKIFFNVYFTLLLFYDCHHLLHKLLVLLDLQSCSNRNRITMKRINR